MARNNRHNAAFVVGSVLGAVVGAGAALWKTPYTGEELRQKLMGGGSKTATTETRTVVATPSETETVAPVSRAGERSIKDKVLSSVEKTLAPIVGVELGKTANGSSSGSTAKVVKDPSLKVKPEPTERLGRTFGWKGTQETADAAAAHAGNESQTLGLHRDRVDPEQWAAAYGGQVSTSASTSTNQPAHGTTPPSGSSAPEAVEDPNVRVESESTPRLGRTFGWTGTQETADAAAAHAGNESQTLGLHRDRVDPEKWAAAYGGQADTSSRATTSSSSSGYASTGETSVTGTSNAARESAEETGQGADPAYPGDDGDFERHPPVDRGPVDNIAPATHEDDSTRSGREFAADAATVDQLTTPQTDRTPDALVEHTERAMHPFPRLGGKESR